MAEGALNRSHADIALGVTGFAGPAGDRHEQGLVHIALARREPRHFTARSISERSAVGRFG